MTRPVRDRILKDVNGNINDHLRNHIHLTNCIHLKNHMHNKHSPILTDRALMRDLVVLQRSRSLRDPSASPRSWHSPSPIDVLLKRAENEINNFAPGRRSVSGHIRRESVSRSSELKGYREDRHLINNTLPEKLSDDAASSRNHGDRAQIECMHSRAKRRRFRGARRARPSAVAHSRDDEPLQNEMSVASNQNVNGCGVPWNWSRIHDRGKSFLDLAGRSLSCGLSESRLRRGGPNNNNIPVDMSEYSSSSTSKSEALPLLLDSQGSVDDRTRPGWFHDYSGELGIYADNLLKNETDSDLASVGRSREKHHNARNERRHQNLTQKYGPRTFRDLVGQSLAVQALSNAITKRKIGLLYLFYGPNGTGKTSCARIFARALNCQSLEQPKPCGLCSSCVKSRNVKEIGPVSNIDSGGIIGLLDDMIGSRTRSEYRVLIFDECDSLSPECWSAILKVIDRAPRRVVFVLVCSGFDVLPHVIISRCQKFYFPKLKDADVIYTLQWIASKEDLEIDKDALKLIASRSDGSLRDAVMTLEQLSLIEKRISLCLVQELIGLISDEKLVDLLDLALSADTVNTVKNLRDIMESGVEPLALMSQLATVITDILAGSYDFTKEGSRRKFFRRPALSKEDMEKLRQALKTLSEAEKQLRVSNDRMTWLTAALLQLAPDQQYMLPSSDTSFHQSPLVANNASLIEKPRKSISGNSNNVHYNAKSKGTGLDGSQQVHVASNDKIRINNGRGVSKEIDEIWLQVLEKIPINSVKEFMYREGKLIAVNYGAAPTVQLLFNSHPTKSKAEKFRLHILQAFESVLRSPVTIEIRCEPRKDVGAGPILLPAAQYPSHLDVVPATHNTSNNGMMPISTSHDDGINHRREIVEIEASPRENTTNGRGNIGTSSQKISALLGERAQSLSIVRGKVSLAHVIQHAEGSSQHSGWSQRKAISIAEKLEQENLRLESRSRRLFCWNPPNVSRRKAFRFEN
ncbi:hypothetical protein CASFOL_040807 [Castilleja foliolosa]|uniref:AAA+ ATPase domain-containing protein n=1 Tax=Castilleja foliolosa TaxID=1961234 RepID=A0ABD3BDI0_9LAMI